VWWEVACKGCGVGMKVPEYRVEMERGDDGVLGMTCMACGNGVEAVECREVVKPSREQVEAWKEIGSRLLPKVERVHHQFEKSEIIFSSSDGEAS